MVFQEKLLSHYVGHNHTVWLRNFPKCCSNSALWNLFWGEYCFSYKEKVTVKWKFTCKIMFPLETVTFYCNFTTFYIILYVVFFVLLSVVLNWKIYSHSSEKYLSFKELNPQPPRNVEVFYENLTVPAIISQTNRPVSPFATKFSKNVCS